jgi:hypothetical protein
MGSGFYLARRQLQIFIFLQILQTGQYTTETINPSENRRGVKLGLALLGVKWYS